MSGKKSGKKVDAGGKVQVCNRVNAELEAAWKHAASQFGADVQRSLSASLRLFIAVPYDLKAMALNQQMSDEDAANQIRQWFGSLARTEDVLQSVQALVAVVRERLPEAGGKSREGCTPAG